MAESAVTIRNKILGAVAAIAILGAGARAEAANFIRDAEIESTLERLSAPIFRAAGLAPDSVRIFIIQDNTLNAFVAGRNMAFHTGLLMDLEAPEELIGVIAHETGHIAGGHGVQRMEAMRNATGPMLLSMILGIAAAAAGAPQAGAAIFSGGQHIATRGFLKYTRGQESAADQAAVTYMEATGIDPSGMIRTFERLKADEIVAVGRRDPYTLSHPLSRDRIAALEQRVARSPVRGRPAPRDDAYWHARMRAKLQGFLGNPLTTLRLVPASERTEPAILARAVAYHRSHDLTAAVREADALLQMRPNDPYYHELKGQILFEGGKARQASGAYRRAASLAPGETLIQTALAQTLLALNDPAATQEAKRALLDVTRRDRLHAEAWRQLSIAQARTGDDLGATLATADYQVLTGSLRAARRNAERVRGLSPQGSSAWLRADDILVAVDRALNKDR